MPDSESIDRPVASTNPQSTGAADNAPALDKTFKPSWVFAMALGSAIGWGAFILPFDWMSEGGLYGTLLGFLIGGFAILVVAFSYGFVVRALPVTGGGVAFALASLGRIHAFIAGWALTLGYAGIVALNASAITLVFRVTLPDLFMRNKLYEVAGWDIYLPEVLIASLFIIVFGFLNYRGASISGRFQFYAVVLIIVSVAIIFVSMVIYYFTNDITMAPGYPSDTSPLAAIAVIVAFAPWAYVGFDSVPQLAGEFNFSPRKALGLLIWGVSIATLIYMTMMIATSIAVADGHANYADDAWPPAAAISDVMGPVGLILMVIAVSAGVLTGLNGFYTATSRVLFTMGKAQMLPSQVSHIHPKHNTPVIAIVVTALLCLISPWFGRAALNWVVDMTSVGITIAYFYACYCAYKIARDGKLRSVQLETGSNPVQKWISLAGCILSLGFMALLLVPGSPGMLSTESFYALAAWLILGLGFFWMRSKVYLSQDEDELKKVVLQ